MRLFFSFQRKLPPGNSIGHFKWRKPSNERAISLPLSSALSLEQQFRNKSSLDIEDAER